MIISGMLPPSIHCTAALAAASVQPPTGALRLADWGVIRARGDDARSFLHAQLTSDIKQLDAGAARLAGYCSPKGRLLATFVVWPGDAGEVLLACSADLLEPTLKRLTMYVLRARCRLDDASAEFPLWGLAGAQAMAAVDAPGTPWRHVGRAGGSAIALPPARVADTGVPRALFVGAAAPALPALAADAWCWLEVLSGVPRIVAATVERFVPQTVNLELVGGVDFQKGCYPGQEVVARSQYRGTLKRRGCLLAGAVPFAPAQELFDTADPGQPAGTVALAGSYAGLHVALAELKIAAQRGADLHLGSADGPPIETLAPPYPIPLEGA